MLKKFTSVGVSIPSLTLQVVDVHHPALLRNHPDDAGSDWYATADGLILVAPAGDDSQHPVVGLEQEYVRVVEFEQLVHRP